MGIEASRVSCPKELLRPKHVMYTVTNNIYYIRLYLPFYRNKEG